MPPRRRDRRRPRDPSPPHSDARAPPSTSGVRLGLLAPVVVLVLVLAGLGFRLSRSPPHPKTLQTTAHSVYERGLVKSEVSAREILNEHARVSENRWQRHFPNPVLAYVTPCDRNRLVLEGQHNFDATWVSELQSNGTLG
nr:unnamed protein product [Digitaria exilis]